MKISCIIIDDEPIALDLIKRYVLRTPELELSGEFSSGMEAISFLKNNQVDLIFTDKGKEKCMYLINVPYRF